MCAHGPYLRFRASSAWVLDYWRENPLPSPTLASDGAMTRGESSLDQRLVESRAIFRPSIRQATSCASSGSTGRLPAAIKNAVPYRSDFLVTGEGVAMRISPIAPDQLCRLKRDFLGCHPGQAVPVAYQDHGRVAMP